ncbi:MAG: hypothetical protein JWO30_4317 [Fibrobacteres bacterium]|nr:hypothetical protein [Fibrobacterota bacterium]
MDPGYRIIAIASLTGLLMACGEWKADSSGLTARTAAPVESANCASCHGYPLQDTNHVFHLFHTDENKRFNGPITCLDCHNRSLQYDIVTLVDTIYVDTTDSFPGNWSTVDFPDRDPRLTFEDTIRTFTIKRIDTLHQHRPIPLPERPGPPTSFTEYVTGLAHLNGAIDVEFDPKISDVARFGGEKAGFNPTEETCSAVACHPGDKPYRFAAPSKHLPEMKE